MNHPRTLILGMFAATATFVHFYLMTVFSLSWATTALKIPRTEFLVLQMIGVLFFAATIPLSAVVADRRTRRGMLIMATLGVIGFGMVTGPLFGSGTTFGVLAFLCLGLGGGWVYLRAVGDVAGGVVSDCRALYGGVVDIQPGRDRGGVAGAVYCDVPGEPLRDCLCWVLPFGGRCLVTLVALALIKERKER